MTEKVLPYDRSIVPQETGYWCGPASTQVILNSRGIIWKESDLAREIGTTTRGTDYVGLIERVLDRVTPDANYTSVYTERDPMTNDQKETFWRNIVQSIDGGYGVSTNIVAPPNNKPRGVLGSVSPSYSGGTTYHYIAIMGYHIGDDGFRAVWVADSGFRPFGYWCSFDQMATLVPPKGYCYANTGPVVPPTAPQIVPVALFSKAMGDTIGLDQYAALLPGFVDACEKLGVTENNEIAMLAAQFGHESVGLKYMRELWGPTADQLNYDHMMGNGPGEGRKYLGRGPIQVTGKDNYRELSRWAFDQKYIDSPTLFLDQPELLEQPQFGFLGAVWYIKVKQPRFMEYARAGDIENASKAINAPAWIGTQNRARGIDDRIARWNRCRAMDLMPLLREEDDPLSDPILAKLIGEIHGALFNPIPSLSRYREDYEGNALTTKDIPRNVDKFSHEEWTETAAIRGNPKAVKMVARNASRGDSMAMDVFARIPAETLAANGIDSAAVKSGYDKSQAEDPNRSVFALPPKGN
ncbi:endolysin [Mycobacterium phage Indlulamithi]|uniref:Lysin A n=1 Tax=Mycobacterium phage Indlulamithi TaxID=2656582 RepID=A0A649VDP2_9CAUD|nr:endolysin [Mycobacterium phage Indlulamithi]QGJ90072.1 lysin A [Mycobacterium phage Indlulamithi]